MEWALFISKTSDLRYWNKKYSRIYFGNEFCQELIPSIEKLEEVLDFVFGNNLDLTLVTCFVTNEGLNRLKVLLELLANLRPSSEVVVNDWGVLRTVQNYGLRPVLGRLLTKQKRDPRILNLKDKISNKVIQQLKRANLNTYFLKFLNDKGVERVELDNLLQGIKIDRVKSINLSFSLYFPFGYITTTRICPLNPINRSGKRLGIFACEKECQDNPFILNHPSLPVPLLFKGNTVFFENRKIPEDAIEIGINRIVYQPIIPI